ARRGEPGPERRLVDRLAGPRVDDLVGQRRGLDAAARGPGTLDGRAAVATAAAEHGHRENPDRAAVKSWHATMGHPDGRISLLDRPGRNRVYGDPAVRQIAIGGDARSRPR